MSLSKRFSQIDGNVFYHMVVSGAQHLKINVEKVNALNVFPVPDGDTGTNMNLTIASGVEELKKRLSEHIGKAAEALAKGLLMGARGNSGVILSQLFRGFAKAVQDMPEIDARQFALALQNGVDTAYKAVVKPVEGTILTVSREAAKHAVAMSTRTADVSELLKETVRKGYETLSKTPDYLPILKQVGVVDAGGQGLLFIYEGFVSALSGEMPEFAGNGAAIAILSPQEAAASVKKPLEEVSLAKAAHGEAGPKPAQAKLSAEDIEHGYCTEFMVKLEPVKGPGAVFDENKFREQLAEHGDSLLVVADDELVKVHIHAEYPGSVMNLAMQYGQLTRIKIENMREQHSHIVQEAAQDAEEVYGEGVAVTPEVKLRHEGLPHKPERKPHGFVAVSVGDGISDIFQSLGVDEVLFGGQTMNPSTEDIAKAVGRVEADTVFVLPNNSNIVMAAQQVKDVVEDKTVVVVPTKTIPQGMAAVLAYKEEADAESNADRMNRAMKQVQSGQVTFAVRDTQIDGVDIKEGDYIGIHDGRIVASHPELMFTCKRLLDSMLADGAEIVTVYAGEDALEEQTEQLAAWIGEAYSEAEIEVHQGGQPLYYYIFSAE